MCGILFVCRDVNSVENRNTSELQRLFDQLRDANARRGPDAQGQASSRIENIELSFYASELRLRGNSIVSQPHQDCDENILCWNGEIFEGLEVLPEENDGIKLFSLLRLCQTPEDIRNLLGRIEGPYAIVYYHHALRKLFFARDPLGRRCLLIHRPTQDNPRFILCSVSVGSHPLLSFEELSTDGIFCLDLASMNGTDNRIDKLPVVTLARQNRPVPLPFAESMKVNRTIPEDPPRLEYLGHIPDYLTDAVDGIIAQLDRSVKLRTQDIPCHFQVKGSARVAVFFSGGIDSTMIAFLADRHVDPEEPIDLLNVAFENPRKILVQAEGNIGGLPKRERKQKLKAPVDYATIGVSYNVPDRLTGLQELEELRRLCPKRTWNFVEVNVPYEESQDARSVVEALMFPGRTVMDLSLAIALYFAARGVGQIRSHEGAEAKSYTSTARVLLNGLGSDELLGGYGRHRTSFKVGGWQAIVDELQLEIDRIPTRNLGRDDRVISSHGKETRHPFLSLSVVSFLAQLPVHLKLDPRLPPGIGEKMLLRLAARKVGLVEASSRKKRAMQFGSHSARMGPGEGDRKGDLLLAD